MTDKPWLTEPNELRWTDEDTGLECLIKRNPELLHLCGYVKIDPTNALYGKKYTGESLNVHGSVTWQGKLEADKDAAYYIGFDCGHFNDYVPGMANFHVQSGLHPDRWGIYRDIEFVKAECAILAAQVISYKQKVLPPAQPEAKKPANLKFVLEIDCGNDAFTNNPMLAVSNILQQLSDTLYTDSASEAADWEHNIHDANGNTVGKAEFTEGTE